jgi:hypothetical protein
MSEDNPVLEKNQRIAILVGLSKLRFWFLIHSILIVVLFIFIFGSHLLLYFKSKAGLYETEARVNKIALQINELERTVQILDVRMNKIECVMGAASKRACRKLNFKWNLYRRK